MLSIIDKKYWQLWLITIFLLGQATNLVAKTNLLNVFFLPAPNYQLIFEFDKGFVYDIKKDNNKLEVILSEVLPRDSQWIKALPRDFFKEIDVIFEKERFHFVFTLTRNFNFQASVQNNRLIIHLLWEAERKISNATLQEANLSKLSESRNMPNYNIPVTTNASSVTLPLTKSYKGQLISVDFQEADLHAVFRFLAEVSGLNILVSDKVKGTITLKLRQVPWDQVLDIVLSHHGLGYLMVGNVMRIVTIDEIKVESDRYREYLTSLKDIQEKGPLFSKSYQLKYAKGDALVSKLKEIFSGEGKITYEPTANVLIIKDTQKNLEEIEKIIKDVDRPTKQVLIEARIVEIMDTYSHRLGVKWGGAATKSSDHTILGVGKQPNVTIPSQTFNYPPRGPGEFLPDTSTGSIGFIPSGIVDLGVAGTTNLGFAFGHVGKSVLLLDVELSALENEGVARIFATPKILTLDNQPAEIKQGYKVPYLQLSQYGVATTQFIEAVLRLKVTPHVTPDHRISLEIEIEKSTPDWGRVVNSVPALVTRSAFTKTLLNNGETIVIGGIKTNDLGDNLDQVPGLGRIPGLGEAFKRKEKNLAKTELFVFITPKIVTVEIPGVDY